MKTAMILAAGRGERLKPLSALYPKAMCPLNQIPLIEHHVINLAKAGFTKLIINHAYLGDKIRHYLQHGKQFGVEIIYSPEPPGGLETGGGIVNALSLLGKEPFITVNADIYTHYDFASIQLPKHSLAHLVFVNNPPHKEKGDFGLTKTQQVQNDNRSRQLQGQDESSPNEIQNRVGKVIDHAGHK